MSDVEMLRGMIDKYLAEEEYEIVSKLAEVLEEVARYQEMKDFESEMEY